MKSVTALIALLALGAIVTATAFASAPRHASVTIRHEMKGCHAWSIGGSSYTAHVTTKLAKGGSITFTNNDVMPHQLLKSGPAVVFYGSHTMRHIGASVKVTFPHSGIYHFTTKAGEDYTTGIKTIGEDNVLTLTVTVR